MQPVFVQKTAAPVICIALLTPICGPIITERNSCYISSAAYHFDTLISMNRTSLLLIACLLSLAIAAGPFGPCPMNCLCTGIVPGGCTKCKDAHGDVATQCKTCLEGYGMNGEGTCVAQTPPTKPICPSACECRGFVPWTCTSCKDVNANLSTNCSECKTGFVHNLNGDCVDSNPQSRTCPSYCVCNGFVPWSCTRCPDQKKTL